MKKINTNKMSSLYSLLSSSYLYLSLSSFSYAHLSIAKISGSGK